MNRIELLNETISIDNLQTRVAAMDKELLRQYTDAVRDTVRTESGNRSLSVTATTDDNDSVLMLPVTYDSGWRCTVNGKHAPVHRAMGNFLGVPLEKGENTVKLTFLPKGFRLGLPVSIVSVIALAIWWILDRKNNDQDFNGKFAGFVWSGYFCVVCGAYVLLYVVPMICRVITLFQSM